MSLRIGIVGSGFMGRTHAAGWSATPAQIVGFHSAEPVSARALAAQYGAALVDRFEDLLDACDVVDICTPTPLHHAHGLQAAAAGKAVICEKPLARTTAQAAELVATCERAGVPLLVGHVVRFFPEYAAAQAIVARGDIGRVAVIRLTRASFRPNASDPTSWFHDPAQSGGMMMDLMIHDYDYARWIGGEVESVFARSSAAQNPASEHDYGLVILQHKNGALSHIEGGWAYPPPMFRTALEIAGDRGLIEHPAGSSTPLHLHMRGGAGGGPTIAVPASPLREDPYTAEIREFYALLSGQLERPRVTARDGLAAVQIAEAALESARTGRPVYLEALP